MTKAMEKPNPITPMIKVLYWNAIGVGNNPTKKKIVSLDTKHDVDILPIVEPMIDVSNINYFSIFWECLVFSLTVKRERSCGFYGRILFRWTSWIWIINVVT